MQGPLPGCKAEESGQSQTMREKFLRTRPTPAAQLELAQVVNTPKEDSRALAKAPIPSLAARVPGICPASRSDPNYRDLCVKKGLVGHTTGPQPATPSRKSPLVFALKPRRAKGRTKRSQQSGLQTQQSKLGVCMAPCGAGCRLPPTRSAFPSASCSLQALGPASNEPHVF